MPTFTPECNRPLDLFDTKDFFPIPPFFSPFLSVTESISVLINWKSYFSGDIVCRPTHYQSKSYSSIYLLLQISNNGPPLRPFNIVNATLACHNPPSPIVSFKLLGITLDPRLNWKAHINDLLKNVSSYINLLKMLSSTNPLGRWSRNHDHAL